MSPTNPNRSATRPAARALAPCKYCAISDTEAVRVLLPLEGGEPVHVCSRCLRTLLLRKADLSQGRNGEALDAFAQENGLKVWCSHGVGYALPPMPTTR